MNQTTRAPARDVVGLLRDSIQNLGGGTFSLVANLAVVALLSRALGAGGTGALFTAVAVVTMLQRVATLGSSTGLVRFVSRALALARPRDVHGYLMAATIPAMVAAVAVTFVLYHYADLIAVITADQGWQPQVAAYLEVAAWFFIPAVVLVLATDATRGAGTMWPSNLTDNGIRPLLQVAAAVAVVVFGASTRVLAVGYWGAFAVAAVVALVLAARVLSQTGLLHFPANAPPEITVPNPTGLAGHANGDLAREYWGFTTFRALAAMLAAALEWSDVLLLGGMVATATAGIYAAATRFLGLGRAVQTAATHALKPRISALLAAGDHQDAQRVFRMASAWSVLLTWPGYIVAAVFAPELLGLLNSEFSSGATAARILAVAWMIAVAFGPVDSVLLMAGRSWWSLANNTAAFAANLGLNLLLIPRYGATGAAIAWFAAIALRNLLPLWQLHHKLRLNPFGSLTRTAMVATMAAVGLPSVAARIILGGNLAALAVAAFGAAIAYGITLTRSPTLDVRRLKRLASKRRSKAG